MPRTRRGQHLRRRGLEEHRGHRRRHRLRARRSWPRSSTASTYAIPRSTASESAARGCVPLTSCGTRPPADPSDRALPPARRPCRRRSPCWPSVCSDTGFSNVKARKSASSMTLSSSNSNASTMHLVHHGRVPVRDVGAEDGPQLHRAVLDGAAGRPADERIVGLAPEVHPIAEHVDDVVDAGESSGGELVQLRRSARGAREVLRGCRRAAACTCGSPYSRWCPDHARRHRADAGSRSADRAGMPLVPVADQVCQQAHRPGDAAFEEPDAQLGEAPENAAHHKGFGQLVVAHGQAADVVEDVVGRSSGSRGAPAGCCASPD